MAAAKASARNVDFSNVKDAGNFNKKRIPAGDYLATISNIEDAESKSDGVFQYLVSIKINKKPSSVFPYYCKLQENQLWKLRNLLIAAGIQVPKRKIKVDPNRLIGKIIGVTVEDDEYDGKEQSTIQGVFPASELADGYSDDPNAEDDDDATEDEDENLADLEDEEPEDDEADIEEEEAEVDPYAALDRAALKVELKKRDSSFQARKSQTDDDLRALLREGDGAADDEDDEEEEEPTPPPAKKAAPAARRSRRKAAPKPAEVTDEELEELDIDDL